MVVPLLVFHMTILWLTDFRQRDLCAITKLMQGKNVSEPKFLHRFKRCFDRFTITGGYIFSLYSIANPDYSPTKQFYCNEVSVVIFLKFVNLKQSVSFSGLNKMLSAHLFVEIYYQPYLRVTSHHVIIVYLMDISVKSILKVDIM